MRGRRVGEDRKWQWAWQGKAAAKGSGRAGQAMGLNRRAYQPNRFNSHPNSPSNRWFFRRVPKIPRSGDVKTLSDETNSSAHAELFLVFKTCLGERGGAEPPNECVSVLTRYHLSISGPDPEVFCSHRPTHLMNSTHKALYTHTQAFFAA